MRHLFLFLTLSLACWLGSPFGLTAQSSDATEVVDSAEAEPSTREDPSGGNVTLNGADQPYDDSGWWAGLRGERAPDRLYAGLWTLHLTRTEDGLSQHHLLALGWRGLYLGTFMNSHDNRTWAAAMARSVVVLEGTDVGFSLGYRAGLMVGYDEQLTRLAGRWPAIPAAELVASLRYGRMGIQGQFAGIVTSFGMFIQF